MKAIHRLGFGTALASVLAAAMADAPPTVGNASKSAPPAVQTALRRNLAAHQPRLGKIDEIRATPMTGVYEVRVGKELFYSDAGGKFVINGEMIDTTTQRNLTQDRMNTLLAVDFNRLPLKDAFKIVRGNGKRVVAVFEDPNCGYCRRFEADLQKVENVTIYMFLYPILGPDSLSKSSAIWCAVDRSRTWQDWMIHGVRIPAAAVCDTTALSRNIEFGRQHKITGTPTLIFADGSRVPGAIPAADVEKQLAVQASGRRE